MKFAHLGDCHLGGWRQPELRELNFQSFKEALRRCISYKVDFVLIAGDLFDSAYPPIEILKSTFEEFRKLKEANIPVFLIAGSHDYSASGKSFLDVLEKAGFCVNVFNGKEKDGKILLEPSVYKNVAIYGYPGRKSGLEVEEIKRIKIQDAPGMFKILMLHTTIRDAIGDIPVEAVDETKLPKVDYLALGHLHIKYAKSNRVYCGPTFPNNVSELEELGCGSFYIFDEGTVRREKIPLTEVIPIHLEISNAFKATESILTLLKEKNVANNIVIIRLSGILEKGKISDIDFQKIEHYLKQRNALIVLKSTTKVHLVDSEEIFDIKNSESVETELVEDYLKKGNKKFSPIVSNLMHSLQVEKLEDETHSTFQDRLLSEARRTLGHEI